MKKGVFYAVLMLLLPVGVALSFAESMKVGFVDAQKVFETSDEGKRVQKNVEEYVGSRQKIVDLEEKELREMEEDFKTQASLLSPEAAKMKQDELQRKFAEYQKKARELNKEVQEKKIETNRVFFQVLESVIKDVATKEGYAFVLDKNKEGGTVLYSSDASDITDKVIAQINKTAKK